MITTAPPWTDDFAKEASLMSWHQQLTSVRFQNPEDKIHSYLPHDLLWPKNIPSQTPTKRMTHHPFQSSIWLTPIPQPWPVHGCWQWACNSYCLGQDFHFLQLDVGALAKPVSVVFYGRAWPLDHGLGATEQPAKGPHTTPGAWNLRMELHLAVFNSKQKAYSPMSSLGCPWGVSITSGPSLFFSL